MPPRSRKSRRKGSRRKGSRHKDVQHKGKESAIRSSPVDVIDPTIGAANLTTLWELSEELWCILDVQGCLTAYNAAWQTELGWSREDLLGQPWSTQVHPKDLERTLSVYQMRKHPSEPEADTVSRQDAMDICIDNRYLTQTGNYRWVRWSMHITLGEGQYIVGHLVPDRLPDVPKSSGEEGGEVQYFRQLIKMLEYFFDEKPTSSVPQSPAAPISPSASPDSETLDLKLNQMRRQLEALQPPFSRHWRSEQSPTQLIDDLAATLSSQADQLASRYRSATSVAHLPDFPVSYANLFESLLDSLHPAIPYEISGVILLQESTAMVTADQQREDAVHLFYQQRCALSENLIETLKAKLLETFHLLSGRDLQDFPLYLHLTHSQQADGSSLQPSLVDQQSEGNPVIDPSDEPFSSQIIVPLITQSDTDQQIIGLLFVIAQQAERFTEEHIRLLYSAASHLSVSLQHLQLLWFQAEKQHLSQILNKLPTGVLLLDSDRYVLFSNELAKTYLVHLGMTQHEEKLLCIGNHSLEDLFQCPITDPQCREISAIHTSDLIFEVIVQALIPEFKEGDWIIIIRDISERKVAESKTKFALEKEQELNSIKSRVIRTVSHGYRSPLTSILGYAQLLKTHSKKLEGDQCQHLLGLIENSARHLNQLVDEMLEMEEVESGRLVFRPSKFDLLSFCQKCLEESRILGNHKHRMRLIHLGSCECVYLDPKLLRQILTNLLSNAVKYSPDGGQVILSVSCTPAQINFQVQDQGIGIPAEDQKQLFQSFYRASNVGFIRGSGLGLNITQKFVDLHQGSIGFESEPDQGTTFWVTLPNLDSSQTA